MKLSAYQFKLVTIGENILQEVSEQFWGLGGGGGRVVNVSYVQRHTRWEKVGKRHPAKTLNVLWYQEKKGDALLCCYCSRMGEGASAVEFLFHQNQ